MMRTPLGLLVIALCVPLAAEQAARPGLATLSGRVTDAITRAPLEGAILTLHSAERKQDKLVASSDAEGTFAFEAVSPGQYWLDVDKDGYAGETFGASETTSNMPGVFAVRRGEKKGALDFALAPAGSITGLVSIATGEPLKDAQVMAMPVAAPRPPRRLFPRGVRSNDRGEYTIPNIAEGLYYVHVLVPPEKAYTARFEPLFYPGVPKVTDATPVQVRSRQVTPGINVTVPTGDFVRLAGAVLRGSSAGSLFATLYTAGTSIQTLKVAEDGAFVVARLKPGGYSIAAWAETADAVEAGVTHLDVSGDLEGVLVTLAPTGRISGRVVTDDGAPLPSDVIQVTAALARHGRVIDPLSRNRSDVDTGGAFHIAGVFAERVLQVAGLPGDWEVAQVMRGKTTIETILVLPGEEIGDVVIVLRRR